MIKEFKDLGVVIPVRMESSRIEKKVLLPLHDSNNKEYNLLSWKIRQLLNVIDPSHIFVSTESEELKQIAIKHGCKTLTRNSFLTKGHQTTTRESVLGIIEDVPFKNIAWTTVVVPLMNPQEYKKAFINYFKKVVKEKAHDSLVAVNLLKEYLWNDLGTINYEANENHPISQKLPNTYRVTNGLYIAPKEVMIECGYFLGKNPYKEVVPKISGIDIDEYEDYEIAKSLLSIYNSKEYPC